MFLQYCFRLFRHVALLGLFAMVFPVTGYGMVAGRMNFAFGNVEAIASDGSRHALIKGAEINTGETISTAAGARAQVRFSDGGFISLQPNTLFRVDEFNYKNKTDGEERGFFSLLKGALRAVTGAIGHVNRDTYRVTTPVATIGIRGTGYNVALNDSGLFVNVGEGAISLANNAGLLVVTAGGAAFVKDGNTAPVPSDELPQLSPASFQPLPTTYYAGVDYSGLDFNAAGDLAGFQPLPPGIYVAGNDRGLPSLISGPGYTLAYAYMQCGDGCYGSGASVITDVTADFGGASQLLQYSGGENGALGSASVTFSATDGIIGWGRWDGSTVNPQGYDYGPHPLYSGVFHYVAGIPTADMPVSGSATYNLIGYTAPSATDGSVGWSVNGTISADFSTYDIGVDMTVANTGAYHAYVIRDTMLSARSGATFSGSPVPYSGLDNSDCGNGCSASVNGFFAGSNAARAGLTYSINDSSSNLSVQGAAAFTKAAPVTYVP
ncbi:MAG: FecR domain-containing protein [Nitrosomonadales bacterium]|nr:FecR domain-containing protein [Nitrosomonadales bacterium]